MLSDTTNKDNTPVQETIIYILWPHLSPSAFTGDNLRIIYEWIINIYINIFWFYLSKSSVMVKFSNCYTSPQWTQEYIDIDLNAQNATIQSIKSWKKNQQIISCFFLIYCCSRVCPIWSIFRWMIRCMPLYNIRKK